MRMLGRKNNQPSFMDAEISRALPKEHPLLAIRELVDFAMVEEETKHLYSPDNGRPSYAPEVLFRLLFLEVWANLSDVQVCRETQYNLLYRVFCGIGWDDQVPDDTTLVVFRRRLGEDVFRKLFERVVDGAKAKGLLKGEWTIVDGTKIKAHATEHRLISLMRQGRKRIVEGLRKTDPQKAEELSDLAKPLDDADYRNRSELAQAEADRTEQLLKAIDPEPASRVAEDAQTLHKIVARDGTTSFADPEARWGFQKKDEPFLGYKTVISTDESGIVTGVRVVTGNESEVDSLLPLIKDLKARGLAAGKLAADKGYDGKELREELRDLGVRAYTPKRQTKDNLPEGFTYDHKRDAVRCPKGKLSHQKTPHKRGGILYSFRSTDCQRCPLRDGCLTASRRAKIVYYRADLHEHRPKGIHQAMRIRRTVERVFGDAKYWHRMERSRYTRRRRVATQVLLTMTVLNAKKMVKLLTAPKRAPRSGYLYV